MSDDVTTADDFMQNLCYKIDITTIMLLVFFSLTSTTKFNLI